jgi:minimal PKS ketosynthase (KS/KS alpha)
MEKTKVVITGLGAISPAGTGVDAVWEVASKGIAQGELITMFDVSGNRSRVCAQCNQFLPEKSAVNSSKLSDKDKVIQYAIVASAEAWRHAGLDISQLNPSRVGVTIGTAVGGVETMEQYFRRAVVKKGRSKPDYVTLAPTILNPKLFYGFLASSPASEVAKYFNASGYISAVTTGCTAGIDSIGVGVDLIEQDMADVVIAGASEAPFTPIVLTAFDNIHCLTRKNHDPMHASRPFDRLRDGFLLGEGAGILILESEKHAKKRGVHILAEVKGYASLSNAFHMTALSEQGDVQALTIKKALIRAALNPEQINYYNAHGTSTPQNDISETNAFKQVFGDYAYHLPISSTKSVIGHALGAASAIASVVCIKAICENLIPPTANYQERDPNCDLDYVPNTARERPLKYVGCNASGFSGIHSAIIYGCA